MNDLLALSRHAGVRLAEVAFLLIVIAGVWLAASQIPRLRLGSTRAVVGGLALAAAGVLLIIAAHWGHYG